MTEIALIGKKIGMTREFFKTGQSIPVTVLKVEKGRVIQLINKENRGYNAIQLGFGKIKNSKLSKSMKFYSISGIIFLTIFSIWYITLL